MDYIKKKGGIKIQSMKKTGKSFKLLLACSILATTFSIPLFETRAAQGFRDVTWDGYSHIYMGGNKHTALASNGSFIKSENLKSENLDEQVIWEKAMNLSESYASSNFNANEQIAAISSMPSLESIKTVIASNGYVDNRIIKQSTWWLSDDVSNTIAARGVVDADNNTKSYYSQNYQNPSNGVCKDEKYELFGGRPIENKKLGGGVIPGETLPDGRKKVKLSSTIMEHGWAENVPPGSRIYTGSVIGNLDPSNPEYVNFMILSPTVDPNGYGNMFSDDKCTNRVGSPIYEFPARVHIGTLNGRRVYNNMPVKQGDCVSISLSETYFNKYSSENYFLKDLIAPNRTVGLYAKIKLTHPNDPAKITLYGDWVPHQRVILDPGKTCQSVDITAENNGVRPIINLNSQQIAYLNESVATLGNNWKTNSTVNGDMPISHMVADKAYVPSIKDNVDISINEAALSSGLTYDKQTNTLYVDTDKLALTKQIKLPINGSDPVNGTGYISVSATDNTGKEVFGKLGKTTGESVALNLDNLARTGTLQDKESIALTVYREDMTDGNKSNYVSNGLPLKIVGKKAIHVGLPKVNGPADAYVMANEEAVFKVDATFDDIPGYDQQIAYQWYENKNGNFIKIAGATTDELRVTGTDGTQYYCAVSNVAGIVNSRTATLHVQTNPLYFLSIPEKIVLKDMTVKQAGASGTIKLKNVNENNANDAKKKFYIKTGATFEMSLANTDKTYVVDIYKDEQATQKYDGIEELMTLQYSNQKEGSFYLRTLRDKAAIKPLGIYHGVMMFNVRYGD